MSNLIRYSHNTVYTILEHFAFRTEFVYSIDIPFHMMCILRWCLRAFERRGWRFQSQHQRINVIYFFLSYRKYPTHTYVILISISSQIFRWYISFYYIDHFVVRHEMGKWCFHFYRERCALKFICGLCFSIHLVCLSFYWM